MSQFNSPAALDAYLHALENRVTTLEAKLTHGSGAPPTGFREPYVDDTNSRVYYYVNGVAKSAALS